MGKLDGKVAIVTGAARGLGRAYAKRLAGLGAKVAVLTSIYAPMRNSKPRPRI
jgi:NAD(P)-dependent dehydrogenase (short-subunit alcohol dehydrogenase family)